MTSHATQIAQAAGLQITGVQAALSLFDEGATLPFVARYRKERTGGLDEVQLRSVVELRRQLTELDQRRDTIIEAISGQGALTPALRTALVACTRKSELEDLYAPYKKRRKTRADVAREAGYGPIAERIHAQPQRGDPAADARRLGASADDVLQGARDIVAEDIAGDAACRAMVRQAVGERGWVAARLKKGKDAAEFRDYAEFSERARTIPSHRYLAVCRGEQQGVLSVTVRPDVQHLIEAVVRGCRPRRGTAYGEQLHLAATDSVKRLLLPAGERGVRRVLKDMADDEAINVFQKNLEALLLAAPLGPALVLGIDPGIRTGCKCAMVAPTGEFLDYQTLHLVGRKQPQKAELLAFLRRHRPQAVAVGNGTGGREAESIVREVVREHDLPTMVVSVNEAGASVYSASELAGQELPGVDLTVRGAVSIARRLQDPLAELVKVEPKAIGVGQYQHDVDQGKLVRRLGDAVESCVNRVGVNVNTASSALLSHVAGLGPKRADAIVAHRLAHGPFQRRRDLLKVAGLGRKTYEQCAGFLRIVDGDDPLDNSAVHPERYPLVQRMARDLGVPLDQLVASAHIDRLDLATYQDPDTGLQTLRDIIDELRKPGRDPRESFETVAFRDDVRTLADVREGMELHGVVTNVTNFGAFVDIGVHQDGLVHISQLADRFVRDPHEVVHAGQKVTVRVMEVDAQRKRIALSMKTP